MDDEARQNALSSKLYQVAKQQKTKQDGTATPSPPPPTPAIPSETANNIMEHKPVSILKSADSKPRTTSAKSVTIESPRDDSSVSVGLITKSDSMSTGLITSIEAKSKQVLARPLSEAKEELPKPPVVPPLKRIAIAPSTASSTLTSSPLNRPREMKKTLGKIHETTAVSNVTSSLYVLPKVKPGKSKGLRQQNVIMTGSSIGHRNG